ncbi:SGNH/GDSL hydrolase family protein, partial [Streptomyces broussonetiae]
MLTGMALAVVPLSTAHVAHAATSSPQGRGTRVSAWSPGMTTGGPSFANQTIRMVVHSSVAGSGARITLSNRYSTTPLDVGAVDVAVQASGGQATRGTIR